MKKSIKVIGQIILGAAAAATLFAGRAMATTNIEDCVNATESTKCAVEAITPEGVPTELFGNAGIITNITNTLLAIVGIIAVIMLIYGGVRYIISGGDQKKVTDAKNTILYAIIGLIISLLSYAIINFVLNSLTGGAISA